MVKNEGPKFQLTKPLAWLDEGEIRSQQWLINSFGLDITAFENTVNVVSFAIDELAELFKLTYTLADLENSGEVSQRTSYGRFSDY